MENRSCFTPPDSAFHFIDQPFHYMRTLLIGFAFASFALFAKADEAPKPNYVYRAELVRVVDGSTVALNIDLGFGVWMHNQSLALLGSEAAPDVDISKRVAKLRELLVNRGEIIIQTVKDKKTGRYLATIWADGVNINDEVKRHLSDPLPCQMNTISGLKGRRFSKAWPSSSIR